MKMLPVYGIDEFLEEKKQEAFYSNRLNLHLQSHKFVNAPHKHSTYIVVLFTKGVGEHQIDFDTYEVKPGSVFLLNPGQVHSWKLSPDADGYVFFHPREFYDEVFVQKKIEDYPFFFLQKNHPVVYLQPSQLEKVEPIFYEINTEFSDDKPFRNGKLAVLVDLVYIELSRLYEVLEGAGHNFSANYLKVKRLQKLIDENFKTVKFPSQYADQMNMSTRHLSRICQETLHKSTNDLIMDRIVMEAKRLLVHSDMSISEVADILGFTDYSHFGRLFKNKVGITPKEFQHQVNKF